MKNISMYQFYYKDYIKRKALKCIFLSYNLTSGGPLAANFFVGENISKEGGGEREIIEIHNIYPWRVEHIFFFFNQWEFNFHLDIC